MKELSARLLRLVETAETRLREVSEPQSARPVLPGGWSRREVIGHLVDSASNNHQRFVRAALQPSLDFPACDQAGSVRLQAFQEADWRCWCRCGLPTIATSPMCWPACPPRSWTPLAASVRGSR